MPEIAPIRHRRRSIRIQGYDYSQAGSYFITTCTGNRQPVLGSITDSGVTLSLLGEIVSRQWSDLPKRFQNVELDAFVVMPNHVHGIIVLGEPVGATLAVARDRAWASPAPTRQHRPGLGDIVGSFKSRCVVDWLHYIRENHLDAVGKFWQRNYYEHIVRDENDLNRIREYIASNPFCWESDRENPSANNRATRWYSYEATWYLRCLSDD